MDINKYEAIAHTELKYVSPLRSVMVDEVTELMRLEPGDRIIDVGCAKAEILIRMAELCQVAATGIDTTLEFLQTAEEEIANRVPAADITLDSMSIRDYHVEPESYDGVMCVHSSELYGNYDNALAAITQYAKPGGMVLMGDYYWRGQPIEGNRPYPITHDYVGAVQAGVKQGLAPLYMTVCTQIDLDRYAWLQTYSVEMYAAENPDDNDVPEMLARCRSLRDEYMTSVRESLGFGLFLFRKPD